MRSTRKAPVQEDPACPAATGSLDLEALRAELRGKNVNETSFLATDYMTQFGEVIMLLELLPDMPECFDQLAGWKPKGYGEHFHDSGFQDAELIIRAYDNAPENFRAPFDRTIAQMDRITLQAIAKIETILAKDELDELRSEVEIATRWLTQLSQLASGIINAEHTTANQDMIDQIMMS